MSYGTNNRGGGYGNNIRKARRVQARRSDHAKEMDSVLKAPKAKNVDQWLSAPNRFDLPTVDMNKPQKRTGKNSMSVTLDYFWKNKDDFDRLINKDDIEENNSANKKVIDQILNTLDKNGIPYYYGGEDTGVQILIKDMEKAEKLTDKQYVALKKTF